jgi:DNA ligase (NAD+)
VSGKTSFLLAGEKAGPEKLKKAESLGVKVIGEAEFMEMIQGESPSDPADNSAFEGEQLSLF